MSTTREKWTLGKSDFADLEFCVMPEDGGQIVEVSYALWSDGCGGGLVVRQTRDRSDGEASYEAAESVGDFEPQNGDVGDGGEWLPLEIKGR